ncbi:hypothetical protein GM418_18480 [Maribellus comscasis]|uniref:UspA domain-containing protein n=1 Tax=Maribellus comscasis TaxID=2681766 RepID=A0A6I6JRE1_9BACT|nr:universal stress protein [Maribellus comscasis]QGY45585.1 hypothetical protein GM418_18480 [Maribellus comscasis]
MNQMSNSILAYIPQNSNAKSVLKQFLRFHKPLKMRIFFLNILERSSFLTMGLQPKKKDSIKDHAKQNLIDFLKKTTKKELPDEFIPRIKMGEKLSTLIKESKNGGYDFIALDKNDSGLKNTMINKLIIRSHCPVLLLNKKTSLKKIKTIVVPIDISQTTTKRLFWATFFAKKWKAKVKIVSALNIDINEGRSLARKNADHLKEMLNKRGVECEVEILKVHNQLKHKVILDYITEENPDLIIIRTHQESIFADRRIGQFVTQIVYGCEMPVFTVGHSTQSLSLDNIR